MKRGSKRLYHTTFRRCFVTAERSPAFQFYPRDFLSDSNVLAMTMAERGCYITLLCLCWTDGSLPADLSRMARLIGLTSGQLQKMWPALGVCFKPHPDDVGRLVQPRLERERVKQDDFRQRQSENGRLGGRPRKPLETQPLPGQKPRRNPLESQTETQTEPKKSSSSAICNLRTAVSPPTGALPARARTGSGVMAGALPRDHARHSWCSDRLCVPDFIHGQLAGQRGGPRDEAETWLKTEWYPAVIARYPGIIGLPAEKFWPREFANEFPPMDATASKRTLALMHGDEAFLRGAKS